MGAERLILRAGALVLATLALAGASCRPEAAPPPPETAVVARAGDGDSLTLVDGRNVRLLQVDAPELRGECFGARAHRQLSRLAAPGARVRLVADERLDGTDRYGRLLRYVFVGNVHVNLELVRRGAASPYFFRTVRGRYADELERAVEEARAARRGYWAACPEAELNPGLGSLTGPAR